MASYQPFNPFPPHENPGYDIILSLSQKKINEQLQKLYTTQVASSSHPLPGQAETGPREYLLDHRLKVLLPRSSVRNPNKIYPEDQRQGLIGYIECPEIVFIPGKYRTVKLNFKFKADDEGYAATPPFQPGSQLQLLDDGEIYSKNIDGWTFSFEADLSLSSPMNIMNEILNPPKNTNDPVALTPEAKAKLEECAVDSRTFLASSIFCLFQSRQIANSFSVSMPDGTPLMVGEFELIQKFSEAVSLYFTALNSTKNLPTTKNQFILGWAITQELQELKNVDGKHTTDKTPRYFVPRRYDVSVTPPPTGYSVTGSINFCLQTFRDKKNDQVDINILNTPNAGVSSFTPQQNITPGGNANNHDGVMVLAKKIFLEKFVVGAFNPSCFLYPEAILRALGCSNPYPHDPPKEQLYADQGKWEKTESMKGNCIENNPEGMQAHYQYPFCKSKMTIECSSDWSNAIASGKQDQFKSDGKRETYVTVITEAITTVDHKAQFQLEDDGGLKSLINGLSSMLGGAITGGSGDPEDLPNIHKVTITQRYKYAFKMAAGNAGSWDVEQLSSSVLPKLKNDNQELEWQRVDYIPGDNAFGTLVHVEKGAVQGKIEDAFGLDSISQNIATSNVKAGKDGAAESLKQATEFTSNFRTTIMLPAGDVFMFKDLDTDKFGNLYSNVNYSTIQNGKKFSTD